MKLLPFQKEFEKAVLNPEFDTIALSGPRSLGKSFLAARVLEGCLTPGHPLFADGREVILGAATLETARMTYGFIREALEPTGEYRWIDSITRLGATHKPTNTKLRVISSNAKASFGLVRVPVVVLDEPGALEIVGGQMLADSLQTAQGKAGSNLKVIFIGTLAPMAASEGHWWFDMVRGGTQGSTWVRCFEGDRKTWDKWPTIRRANPLAAVDAKFRAKLLEERDAARKDTRLKARFLSYRLNLPTPDESETLLTIDDWETLKGRDLGERDGPPLIGVDLGGGRSWSSAVAIWPSGRIEAFAVAPGIPSLRDQEIRDHVPSGLYQQLADDGLLLMDAGLRVQEPATLWGEILRRWGFPTLLIADRFREGELLDASDGQAPLESRVTRWSEAASDIRALRRGVLDGPFSVDPKCADLIAASLAVAQVKNDDQGNTRLTKRSKNNCARDDVAAALTLAAGAWEREQLSPPSPASYLGMID